MNKESKKWIQIAILLAFVVAGIRLFLIWRQRQAANAKPVQQEVPLQADFYVIPKKLYAFDVKSAKAELGKQPVWVREGYKFAYYPYDSRARRSDFSKEAGLLGPIEKLQITDVVLDRAPSKPIKAGDVVIRSNQRQVMAVFNKDGKDYSVLVGYENGGDFTIFPEVFYLQDPHQLYKHWAPETWQAIETHQVKKGMNELQASFALGMGSPGPTTGTMKTVTYGNGGHPIEITYDDGRAVTITTPQS